MTYPCEMIRDLIPLVNDQVASEKSRQAVAEHLSGCEECRRYSEECRQVLAVSYDQGPAEEPQTVERAQSYTKRVKRRYHLMIGAAAAATAVVFLTVIVVIVAKLSFLANRYETTDIAGYGRYEGHIEQEAGALYGRTGLSLFPEAIKEDYTVDSYYYACSDSGFDNSYLLFLDYTLPPEEFRREVGRMGEVNVTYKGQTNELIYDADSFSYPAYVAAFRRGSDSDDYGVFEYALIDEDNNRIICVLVSESYLSRLPAGEALKPPAELNYVDGVLGFSIYAFPAGNGAVYVPAGE